MIRYKILRFFYVFFAAAALTFRRFRHIMKLKKNAENGAESRAALSARGIVEKSNPRPFAGGGSGARGEARLTEKERTVIRWTKISSK